MKPRWSHQCMSEVINRTWKDCEQSSLAVFMGNDEALSLPALESQTSAPGTSGKRQLLSGCDVSPCVSVSSSRQSTSSHRSCSAASPCGGLAPREPASPQKQNDLLSSPGTILRSGGTLPLESLIYYNVLKRISFPAIWRAYTQDSLFYRLNQL